MTKIFWFKFAQNDLHAVQTASNVYQLAKIQQQITNGRDVRRNETNQDMNKITFRKLQSRLDHHWLQLIVAKETKLNEVLKVENNARY